MSKRAFGDAVTVVGIVAAVLIGIWVGMAMNWPSGIIASVAVMAVAGAVTVDADIPAESKDAA